MNHSPPRDPTAPQPVAPDSKLALARRRWGSAHVIQGEPTDLVLLHRPRKPSVVPDPPAA